jgi:hypothetical protein
MNRMSTEEVLREIPLEHISELLKAASDAGLTEEGVVKFAENVPEIRGALTEVAHAAVAEVQQMRGGGNNNTESNTFAGRVVKISVKCGKEAFEAAFKSAVKALLSGKIDPTLFAKDIIATVIVTLGKAVCSKRRTRNSAGQTVRNSAGQTVRNSAPRPPKEKRN